MSFPFPFPKAFTTPAFVPVSISYFYTSTHSHTHPTQHKVHPLLLSFSLGQVLVKICLFCCFHPFIILVYLSKKVVTVKDCKEYLLIKYLFYRKRMILSEIGKITNAINLYCLLKYPNIPCIICIEKRYLPTPTTLFFSRSLIEIIFF